MKNIHRYILLSVIILLGTATLKAQVVEPEMRQVERTVTTLNENYSNGLGFDFVINNFGFGLGGEYRRVMATQTEAVATLRISALRDVSEQTFTDFYWGQQIVPNKYQRVLSFPLMVGIRQRLFAGRVQEEYRFFVSATAGPVAAFSFPYFNDLNNNGYRETGFESQNVIPEPINDILTGWSDGEWHLGGAGEIKFGVDFGRNFARVSSIEFGYYFNYFPDGIQVMMPKQPRLRENPSQGQNPFMFDEQGRLILDPFFEPQSFFGSPQITLTFGRLW